VFCYHVRAREIFGGTAASAMNALFGAGSTGVSFFFLLSGFVLTWSAPPVVRARAFWRQRFARVYPAHLVTMGMAALLAFTLVPGLRPAGGREVVANALLVSAWNREWWQTMDPASWSLVCEAFFYALFPLVYLGLRALSTQALLRVRIGAIVAVLATPLVTIANRGWWTEYSCPLVRLPEFVLGVTIALLLRRGVHRGPRLGVSLLLVLLGFAATHVLPVDFAFAACTVVGFAGLLTATARRDVSGRPSWLASAPMLYLGKISYAFYLVHLLVLRAISALLPDSTELQLGRAATVTAIAFAVTLIVSAAVYHAAEVPGRRLLLRKRRLSTA
jgi:peptidoglycan/LPS O-acetylase OafA/YrhL